MAEVAKADTAKTAAPPTAIKPERPNEEEFKLNLAKAEKELKLAEERLRQIKAKIDIAQPKNKDSPNAKRREEIKTELTGIRTAQSSNKSGVAQVKDKIKRLDETLKSRITEQKAARAKVQYKSAEDIDVEISKLQKQVDSGSMKIVDEKKALAEISQLTRTKKSFAAFEEAQKGIDTIKKEIADLKESTNDPEQKARNERYTALQTEFDTIKADQDEAFKNLNALRDERTKLSEEQNKKWAAVKEIKDQYHTSRRAAQEYEREARRIRDEKRKAENDAYHRGRRQEVAKAKLEDASAPAYQDEIRTTQAILAHLDPSFSSKQEAAVPAKFAASASRTVDASGIKGTALKKKGADEEDYFVGGGGKKKKGGRKGEPNGPSSPAPSKFNLDLGTIDSLAKIGVDPPMSQADVPNVVEKLKEKLDFWKKDQQRKTKENVENAQKEIDRLEAEAQAVNNTIDSARKPAAVNGSAEDAVADATKDFEKSKIEDSTATESTA